MEFSEWFDTAPAGLGITEEDAKSIFSALSPSERKETLYSNTPFEKYSGNTFILPKDYSLAISSLHKYFVKDSQFYVDILLSQYKNLEKYNFFMSPDEIMNVDYFEPSTSFGKICSLNMPEVLLSDMKLMFNSSLEFTISNFENLDSNNTFKKFLAKFSIIVLSEKTSEKRFEKIANIFRKSLSFNSYNQNMNILVSTCLILCILKGNSSWLNRIIDKEFFNPKSRLESVSSIDDLVFSELRNFSILAVASFMPERIGSMNETNFKKIMLYMNSCGNLPAETSVWINLLL
jgi:hypothetical protein